MSLEDLLDVTYTVILNSADPFASKEEVRKKIDEQLDEASSEFAYSRGQAPGETQRDADILDLMALMPPARNRKEKT